MATSPNADPDDLSMTPSPDDIEMFLDALVGSSDWEPPPAWTVIPEAVGVVDPDARWDDIARQLAVADPVPPLPDLNVTFDKAYGRKQLTPAGRAAARYRAALRRLGALHPLNSDQTALTLRLADLLAASGSNAEAFHFYRSVLDQSPRGSAEYRRAARRATAVAQRSDLHAPEELLDDLPETSGGTAGADDQLDAFSELSADAEQTVRDLARFDADVRDWRWITPDTRSNQAAVSLEAAAVRASAGDGAAAARLSIDESAALNDPLPVSVLTEALLASEHDLRFRVVKGERGKRHRMRFMDLVIVQSPLPKGTYADHLAAVLDERCHLRPGLAEDAPTIRDVLVRTGSIPENSKVLLDRWRRELGVTESEVVVNCPYLLRTRAENHDGAAEADLDSPAPHELFRGAAVTSLAWGGAADVGALLAGGWGWGFASSMRSTGKGYRRKSHPFGDETDPADTDQHVALTRDLLMSGEDLDAEQTMARTAQLLDALPDLTKRVFALDHAVAAARALNARTLPWQPNPLALVLVQMNIRRIQWVARHTLTMGGQHSVSAAQVEERTRELVRRQDDLRLAVLRHRGSVPVLVVDLLDHFEDGYAESRSAVDPVDADFDAFYDTAELIRAQLEQQAAQLPVGTVPAHG